MSLTANELSQLRKLQDKMKLHQPLTTKEIDQIEERASGVIERHIGPYPEVLKAISEIQKLLCILSEDNMRLIADVRFLNEKIKEINEPKEIAE